MHARTALMTLTVASSLFAASPFDLARSARVVSSDPARLDGTRAGRLEEFPAEDVFLTNELAVAADGTCTVAARNGIAAVGLEWAERRVLNSIGICIIEPASVSVGNPAVQYWSSQGRKDSWDGIGQTA